MERLVVTVILSASMAPLPGGIRPAARIFAQHNLVLD